jgi:cytochrome c biogenesis protein
VDPDSVARPGVAQEEEANTGLATAPADATSRADRRPGVGRPGGLAGSRRVLTPVRRWWRILTSMRTALLLLFLLALASVPGVAVPQQSLNPAKVADYFAAHPKLAPFLDRFSAFDVFASPWFAAIYLLLFISLVGCLVPRLRVHGRALVRRPPAAPRYLDRLPASASAEVPGDDPVAAARAVRAVLRRHRWRTVVRTERPSSSSADGDGSDDDGAPGAVTISAEKGYLRETANLAFHLALVAVLVGVASGALFGWKASVLLVEGSTFCDTVQAYDQFTPGSRMRDGALPPFCIQLRDFTATYQPTGQPKDFRADVRYVQGSGAATDEPSAPFRLKVNHPLRLDGANVYLINHGYAPVLRYVDRYGTVFQDAAPFLPQDGQFSSEGVYVLPDANQKPGATPAKNVQVAFAGFFLPDAPKSGLAVRSIGPEPKNPTVTLAAYLGDTGLDSGIPRSVYSLDQAQVDSGALKFQGSRKLGIGQSWKLDDGSSLTFVGYREFMTAQVGHDPGEKAVLAGAIVMLFGLVGSLTVRRRRIFVRITRGDVLTVSAGGLARTDADRFDTEFHAEFDRAVGAITDTAGRTDTPGKDDHAG